ncbi:unnamed protein product [Ilex paraguariensis]|uniref:Uncharacterized protein n=1 Tax=Ilex paraguariensis TaxID=185542 RepID=A0ABC8UQJ7_9AQUA
MVHSRSLGFTETLNNEEEEVQTHKRSRPDFGSNPIRPDQSRFDPDSASFKLAQTGSVIGPSGSAVQ